MPEILGRLHVHVSRLTELSDYEIEEANGILRTRRNETEELLLTHQQLVRAFPDVRAFFADPEISSCIAEPRRKQTKRQVRLNGELEQFYCFRLPDVRKHRSS